MKDAVKINEKERKVLAVLAKAWDEFECGAYSFEPLSRITKLTVSEVRRACRSLAKKGYAVFERSLWNDDGPAGAGYRATKEGHDLFDWCQHEYCDKEATHDHEGYKTCADHSWNDAKPLEPRLPITL